jgi:hypothetical protein
VSGTDRTEILPTVKERRLTASPLLLAAGAAALTLVLGVGGWALLGNRSGDGPLVFPWSADKPGDIDVSVSMVPTVDATPSLQDGQSPSPAGSTTVQRSAGPPQVTLSPSAAGPSRPPESPARATAKVASVSGWEGGLKINVDVHNTGSTPLTTWTVDLWFDKTLNVDDVWNATMQVAADHVHLKFTAERPLAVGDTLTFGFAASFPGKRQPRLQTCQIDGVSFSCNVG